MRRVPERTTEAAGAAVAAVAAEAVEAVEADAGKQLRRLYCTFPWSDESTFPSKMTQITPPTVNGWRRYFLMRSAMALPMCAGLSTTVTPASRRAVILAAAVPEAPVIIAPA